MRSLIHSFHCKTAACVVAGCAADKAKQRRAKVAKNFSRAGRSQNTMRR